MRCPGCGGSLVPVVNHSACAPWKCQRCWRGWWHGELQYAEHWDAERRTFNPALGFDPEMLRLEVAVEHQEARSRGVSVRTDQLGSLTGTQLDWVAERASQLREAVEQERARRGDSI